MASYHNKGKVALSEDTVAARRLIARTLRNRGLTQHEIAELMSKPAVMKKDKEVVNEYYLVNPITGEPFDRATISRDLAYIRDEFRKQTQQKHEEWVNDQLAQIEEVKRQAWKNNDLFTVLRALKQESELLGLDAPTKTHISGEITDLIDILPEFIKATQQSGLNPKEALVRIMERAKASAS